MAMKLAFILDPLDSLKIYKDSSFAMMEAAQARGHELFVCELHDLFRSPEGVAAQTSRLQIIGSEQDWYRLSDAVPRLLRDFDAVMMRKDPPFDAEYLFATHLLSQAEREGARCFNSGEALRNHNEKLAILEFPQFIAPTLVSAKTAKLRDFVREQGEAILKPLDSMGGDSIFRVRADDPNFSVILELMTQHETRTIMAQRYLPEIVAGDKRVLLIDGEPMEFALARIPSAGETRGNLAAGGRGVAQKLSARDLQIAQTVGAALKLRGLLLVGLDIIGDCLTEINVTSPTCFREIMTQTGLPLAERLIVAIERRVLPSV